MPISVSIVVRRLALFAAVLGASGCTYKAGYEGNPISRSFAWFSYLNADDIRSQCSGSGPDRYRIVYNGNTDEQVRTYDITAAASGGNLKVQVTGVADWAAGVPIDDLLSPWRGRIERRQLSADQMQAVRSALRASGFYTPPPRGTILRSWSFYWLAASCEAGKFTFNGWGYPSDRFARVTLAGPLMNVDPTGIAFNPPRDDTRPDQDDRRRQRYYQLVITHEGIRDNFTPF